jgi:hypothetical protein
MKQEFFFNAMLESIALIDEKCWLEKYKDFLQQEHLLLFTNRLFQYYEKDLLLTQPLPYFEEEIKQNIKESFDNFIELFNQKEDLPKAIKETITKVPFKHILLLLGQRITPASVQDERAIPPLRERLLESCFKPFNNETSVGVRAWEKHVGRYENSVMGKVKGNQLEKKKKVAELITFMIENATWWNIFYHYKHGLVYEIRIENGQGMRWTSDGKQFIGFLEHFI